MAHTTPLSASTGIPHGSLHPVASSRLQGVRGRPDALAVGVIIWLASELMFFAALVAAYVGFHSEPTIEGTSVATTRAVVNASLLVLMFNFVLSALMFR